MNKKYLWKKIWHKTKKRGCHLARTNGISAFIARCIISLLCVVLIYLYELPGLVYVVSVLSALYFIEDLSLVLIGRKGKKISYDGDYCLTIDDQMYVFKYVGDSFYLSEERLTLWSWCEVVGGKYSSCPLSPDDYSEFLELINVFPGIRIHFYSDVELGKDDRMIITRD
jgi:hypothetical protein